MSAMDLERLLLWPALLALAFAWHDALATGRKPGSGGAWVVPWLLAAALPLAGAIALRWQRLGHGPFLGMYEILLSNAFSLTVVCALLYRWRPELRSSAQVTAPVVAALVVWGLSIPAADTILPPTYETPVLWLHVLAGKVFLGLCLGAAGLAGIVLLRAAPGGGGRFAALADSCHLDETAWRLMAVAIAWQTAMLVAGAWWAQDAWGRYWAWDPLETWAFLTWIAAIAGLHVRTVARIDPRGGAVLLLGVFVLAFLTFFGVPFVSTAPHRGAV